MNVLPIEPRHLACCAHVFMTVFNEAPWNEAWSLPAALARLQEIANTPGFYGIAADDDAEILGFAMGYAEHWHDTSHFYLKEMCVVPRCQRTGIGRTLIQTLSRDLGAMNVEKMYLLTVRDGPAEAFYTRCGFYSSPKMIMMAKYLP